MWHSPTPMRCRSSYGRGTLPKPIEDQNAKIALSLSFNTVWLADSSSNKDKETAAPPANGSIKVPPCFPEHSSICFICLIAKISQELCRFSAGPIFLSSDFFQYDLIGIQLLLKNGIS